MCGRRRTSLVLLAMAALAVGAAACSNLKNGPLVAPMPGIPLRATSRQLRIQVARDDSNLYLRVRFPSSPQGEMEKYFHFADAAWVTEGGGFRDFAAALANDGSAGDLSVVSAHSEDVLGLAWSARGTPGAGVRDFNLYGCFMLCHDVERQMPNWRESDPPAPMIVWGGFGDFADTWTWRANRTNPSHIADDESIGLTGWTPDPGNAPWTDLALSTSGGGTPPFVLGSSLNFAVSWSSILAAGGGANFTDGTLPGFPVAQTFTSAVTDGFKPLSGDAVPAQLLSLPSGSRADVGATAVMTSGQWDVEFTRKLTTGDPAHDVEFFPGSTYDLAFSLHTDNADGRDHYVTLPLALVLGQSTAGILVPVVSSPPDFSDTATFPVTIVEAFLPGVTSYDFVVGDTATREGELRTGDVLHGGHLEVANATHACADCHRVTETDPPSPLMDAGPLDILALRRGGVFDPTPTFEPVQ